MTPESQEDTNNSNIIQITIHYCDNLKTKLLLLQPVIYIHVIDAKTGTYLKKPSRSRAVVSFYENQRNDVDYIMPVMTQPCSITGERLSLLSWEEKIILNEEYSTFVHNESSIILFFEIVDLSPISHTKHSYEKLNQNGMYKIAWAFLKLLGSNGAINTGPKLRLQLFKPLKSIKKKTMLDVEVYKWWLKKSRTPMDASLFISVEPCTTFTAEPALRSMLPFQQEKGSTTFDRLSESNKDSPISYPEQCKSSAISNPDIQVTWSRKNGEPCKIPKKKMLLLNIFSSCQIIKFSKYGRMLAAGCGNKDSYYLMFYEIPNGKLLHKILAHSELIYDLDWSHDDKYLLSASGDYSVKMWNVKSWGLKETFVHPSFVYSAKFHPKHINLFASSCYDHVIRIWTVEKCLLIKELEAHNSTVCTLCWNSSGTKLYSADGIGQIRVWEKFKQARKDVYQLEREINPPETKSIAINKIVLDNEESTLCLFCGDSVARTLCLESGHIVCSYESELTVPKLSKGCCSPCGSLLFLCSDKGKVSVWNKNKFSDDKCDPELLYDLNYKSVSCIDYHPHEHMLALSFWEESVPVHVYSYGEIGKEKRDLNFDDHVNANQYEKKNLIKRDTKPEKHTIVKTDADISTNNVHRRHGPAKYKTQESLETSLSDSSIMHSSKMQEKNTKETLTAVITKSGQFDVIAVPDDSACSDSNTFRSLIKEPVIQNRSSKRSQRRKKLREMNKTLF